MPITRVYLLASCVVFLCAGIIATTLTKWADLQHAADANGTVSSFEHPFFQTLIMFCGETLCLCAYRFVIWRKQRSCVQQRVGIGNENQLRPIWFAVPAIADFTASTTCNIALTMTSASVYQMLRGSTVLFIAVFSHIFLQRRFFRHEYLGMIIVTSGLLVVGVSASLRKTTQEASNPVLGNILVIVGQLIQSIQFVLEEAWMKKYRLPPLLLVGWEGVFGVCITGLSLAVFQAFDGRPDDCGCASANRKLLAMRSSNSSCSARVCSAQRGSQHSHKGVLRCFSNCSRHIAEHFCLGNGDDLCVNFQ
jgi:drug/metabolite transporter (DMT)-like permease